MKTKAQMRRKAIAKQKQKEFIDGMNGGGSLENVRIFLESKGIEIKPLKEFIEMNPGQGIKKYKDQQI